MPRAARGLDTVDAFALGAVGLWWVWACVATVWNGRTPPLLGTPFVAPAVLIAGVALGRLAARHAGTLWTDALLLFPLVAVLPGVRLRMAPGPVPLGYLNANTAAATQVMALLALAMLTLPGDRWRRATFGVGTALAAWSVVRHGSMAGIATAIPVAAVIALMAWRPARRRWWALVLGLAGLVAAALCILWLADQPTWPARVLNAFDPVRKVMWEEALDLWAAHPIAGGGLGSYAEVNPYAHDTDTIAAHSSLLQTGSELGLVGVGALFLVVLAGWALCLKGRAPLAVIGIAAWTALWIHSLVDHLFDYPTLALLAGAVLGWACAATGPAAAPVEDLRRVPRPRASAPTAEGRGAPPPEAAS